MISRRSSAWDAVTAILLVATAVVTAALYPRLPDPMPTHFDVAGRPNGWMPREVGAWVMLAVAALVLAFLRASALLLPRAWRQRLEASPIAATTMLIGAMLCGCQVLLLRAALATPPHLGAEIWTLLGCLLIGLGLLLPRTRRNPLLGVRTAFALTSDENWARTQRVGGYFFTIGGAVVAIAGLAGSPAVAIAALVVTPLGPVLWSWRIARRGPGDAPAR